MGGLLAFDKGGVCPILKALLVYRTEDGLLCFTVAAAVRESCGRRGSLSIAPSIFKLYKQSVSILRLKKSTQYAPVYL